MSFSLALFGFRKLPVFRKAAACTGFGGILSEDPAGFPGATGGAANRLCRAVHAIQPVARLMTWWLGEGFLMTVQKWEDLGRF